MDIIFRLTPKYVKPEEVYIRYIITKLSKVRDKENF